METKGLKSMTDTSKTPKILVTNDDGIYSEGILALYRAMKQIGEVFVVAPDSERSAAGHAITISDPLRVWEFRRNGEFFGWATNGTPADCVKLAVKAILNFTPDLVVSGINLGANTATNVIYSGTVSAATEGTIMGVPSVAFSVTSFRKTDYSLAAKTAGIVSQKVLKHGLPEGVMLNVNIPTIPEEEVKGIRITRQGKGRFEEVFEKRTDPMRRNYYWMAGEKLILDSEEDVDEVAIMNKYISITPLQFDLTAREMIQKLENWDLEL